jgi:hypothetical protein
VTDVSHRLIHRSRIAWPAHDEHRPLAGEPAADPSGLAGALQPDNPPVGDYFGRPGADPADRAPLIAGILQPAAAITTAGRDLLDKTTPVLTAIAHEHIASRLPVAALGKLTKTLRTIAGTSPPSAEERQHEPARVSRSRPRTESPRLASPRAPGSPAAPVTGPPTDHHSLPLTSEKPGR